MESQSPPPCPNCGVVIDPVNMPRGRWDYIDMPDGATVLVLVEPLDPLIIPFLAGRPVAHRCVPSAEHRAQAATLVTEAEAFLRHEATR